MEHEKLISVITRNQSVSDHPDVNEWISQSEENKGEYIRYKNLFALLQTGSEISDKQIEDGLSQVKNRIRHPRDNSRLINLVRYAAIVVLALLIGYSASKLNFSETITRNEIYVPNGSKSAVTLPDGTKVWLSNGTKFIYPEKFVGNTRDVELEGEGFFEVTHDRQRPFIVKIGENRIKVLGTRFAVIAYPGDNMVKTELISGQIQFDIKDKNQPGTFHSYLMKPSQSLSLDKTSMKVTESVIADNFYNYWINGVYDFKDETFEELAKKIERVYNIKVIFEDEVLKKRLFSGSLSINDNIYTLMEVFERASGEPFMYTREGNQIYIKRKLN